MKSETGEDVHSSDNYFRYILSPTSNGTGLVKWCIIKFTSKISPLEGAFFLWDWPFEIGLGHYRNGITALGSVGTNTEFGCIEKWGEE